MKFLLVSLLMVLVSCGKKDEAASTSVAGLDSNLYGKGWAYNNGNVNLLSFSGNSAVFTVKSAGHGDLVTNYTLTPVSGNTVVAFNGTSNSDWTYTATATTLNLCMNTDCYAFISY